MERQRLSKYRAGTRLLAKGLLVVGALGLSAASRAAGDEPTAEFTAGSLADTPKLASPLPASKPQTIEAKGVLAIDLPTVLELARASNTEVQISTEKIREAHSLLSLARMQWVPSLQIGATYLHHEGRIQDIDGTIFDASKSSLLGGGLISLQLQPLKVAVDVLKARQNVHARSGELDRVTRATLQEVSMAYVDLVAAQAGASITLEITDLIEDLRNRAEKFEKEGVGTKVDLQRNRAALLSQLQRLSLAKQNQLAASARLAQLLNMQNGTKLVSSEDSPAPLMLVDENQPEESLIDQARNQGPGLSEVVALLNGLDQQERQLRRIALAPNVSVDVGGGTFGGGFGGSLENFNASSDYSVRMYWDVTKIIGTSSTRDLFASKRRQANLQHEQIIGKLTLGVTVARDTALKARERISSAESEIEMTIKIYETSRNRLQAGEPAAAFEVQQAIGTLGQARANYVAAVIDYNKAQIQLQYLIGVGSAPCNFDPKDRHRHGKKWGHMPPKVKPGPSGPFGVPVTVPVHSTMSSPVSRPATPGPVSPGPTIPQSSTSTPKSTRGTPQTQKLSATPIPTTVAASPVSTPQPAQLSTAIGGHIRTLRDSGNSGGPVTVQTAKVPAPKPLPSQIGEAIELISDSDPRLPARIRKN